MNTSFESIVVNEIHEAREARTARRVMSGRTLLRTILPAVLLLAFAPKAVLGSAVPGPQVPVNTFTAGDQRDPSMAMDAAGNFVVAWTSTGQDGDGDGVFAQRFDADQQPLGTEFHVNTATAGPQFEPAVAMNASGRFVIVWTSEMRDGTGLGLLAQRYAVDGSRVGSEIRVYSATFDARFEPAVSMDSAGNFVVAWSSRFLDGDGLGVFARRYDATGTAQAPPLRVNTTTALDQSQPAVAMAPAGSFVVTWTGTPVMNSQEIYARRYDATGTAQGPEFAVTTSGGEESAIDIDPSGNFLIAWRKHYDLLAQLYDASGAVTISQFTVNTVNYLTGRPAVALGANGTFVIAGGGYDQDESDILFARSYDAGGIAADVEFQVNDPGAVTSPAHPAAAMDPSGNFVIAWNAYETSGTGVLARRYAVAAGVAVSIDDVRVSEGDAGTTDAVFTITLSAPSADGVSVDFATSDDTATATSDYDANSGTVTFARTVAGVPGETSKQVRVHVHGDTVSEEDERFFVDLTNAANGTIVRGRGAGTIANDDNVLSIDDVTVTRLSAGATEAVFTVSLAPPSSETVTVEYATVNGTATSFLGDFVALSGRLTFASGETTKQIHIVINGSLTAEPDQVFYVDLGSAGNATVSRSRGTGIIRSGHASFDPGPPFQVAAFGTGVQTEAALETQALAMNAAGRSVIVWSSPSTNGLGIWAQRYDAAGVAQSPAIQVHDPAFANEPRAHPAVAMDEAGDFVVVWTGGVLNGTDFVTGDIYAQRFDASGAPQGGNFIVNSTTPGVQEQPSIAMYASGEFVVAWHGLINGIFGIVARRFDAQGTPIGGDFQVGTHAGHNPSVSVNPALPIAPPGPPVALTLGDFVVTWSGAGIFARRFEATGRPRGYDDIQVSTSGDLPAVAMDEAEDFVVAWEGGDGISARPFYGATDLMGNQFQVNTSTIGVARPSVGMNANGNFVIAWDGFENPTSATNSVFARSYDASGSARGLEFGVNHPSLGSFRPAARMDAAGDFIISWQADLNFGEVGVFARRFVARTLPSLHISDAGRFEGQSGTTDFIFDVTLMAPSSRPVTVQYHTTDGTATAGDDYEATSGTLTFAADAPGAVSLPIVVHVLGDRRQEPNETFFVDLDPAANATISRSRGVGTIINDDADNTPVGTNVVVNPVDLATGTPSPVTLTFANVTQGGHTDVTIDTVGPPLPSGFALGDPPVYFHVSTTAVFDRSAGVVVCINYSGMTFPPGPGPRLFHSPPTPPEDVTAPGYPDEVHHIVCSRPLSSLSPFAVAQATNRPPVASAGPDQTRECSSPAGAAATLDGSHSSDPDGDLLGFAWTDEGGRAVGTTAIANVTVPLGTHPYVLTVMDPALATGSAATSVTVRDTTVPSIAISPARMTVAVAAVPAPRAAVGLPAPSVSDACDPAPAVSDDAPATFSTGAQTVTFRATDHSGNSAQAQLALDVVLSLRDLAVRAEAELSGRPNRDHFEAQATFRLGPGNNGLDVAHDVLHFHASGGPARVDVDLPLSDFRVDHQGRLKFEGLLGGGKTEIHLQPLRDGRFQLHLEAERLSLAGLSNPLTVELRIGDDVGRLVTAARIEREDEEEETHSRQHER